MERYVIVKPVQFRGRRYRIGDQVDGNIVRPDRAEALIRMKVIARVPETSAASVKTMVQAMSDRMETVLESAAENRPEPARELEQTADQEKARELEQTADQELGQEPCVGADSADPGKAGRKKGAAKREE